MDRWWDDDLDGLGVYAQVRTQGPSGHVRLPRQTREKISERFQSAWKKHNPKRPLGGEPERFLENLEWYAEQYLHEDIGGFKRLNAQATSEKLSAVANALTALSTHWIKHRNLIAGWRYILAWGKLGSQDQN